MGGDSLAVMTPTIHLGRLALDTGCVELPEAFHVAGTRRLSCNPKGFWHAWREDLLRPQHDWRISTKELVLQARVKSAVGKQEVKILVDTGAKIPLVCRHGLFPKSCLKKASFPVHFSTVDGQRMDGGTHGLFLEFWLPMWRQGRLITARTCSLFAYEANIQGIDIIIGYPFLKVFNLLVDAQHDRLSFGSTGNKRDPGQEGAPFPIEELTLRAPPEDVPISCEHKPPEVVRNAASSPAISAEAHERRAISYDVDNDVAMRNMFACDCASCTDPECPLRMYHSMKMAAVNSSQDVRPFEVCHDALQDAVDPLTSSQPLCVDPDPAHRFEQLAIVDEVHQHDDWQYVPINRFDSMLCMDTFGV